MLGIIGENFEKVAFILSEHSSIPIDPKVEHNLERIARDMGDSDDLVIRKIPYLFTDRNAAAIVYIDGLSDADAINTYIIEVLSGSMEGHEGALQTMDKAALAKTLLVGMGSITAVREMNALYNFLLSGSALILLDGSYIAYGADVRHWKGRQVTESMNQTSVRGPKESFTETLRTNTALIRRKIKDPRLWLETIAVGRVTKTDISLMYVKGIVKPSVLETVRSRLHAIDIDSVLEGGYIEEMIEDGKYTLFPTIYNTELPDNVAAQLLEGKVAILVDGSPTVLVVPTQFVAFFQSTEDYYQRAVYASLLRVLRYFCLMISLLFPSLYIAVTTFHREMLPAPLLISLAAQREGVPFPAFVEALAMEVSFEILREAGLRMPRAIGQAISVVGTLVIGQAAVNAGIVSAAMVIVVSVTAISTFTLPGYSMSIPFRILRFVFMGLAASFGIFGILMGGFLLLLHLCALSSFGEPYMAPLSPRRTGELKDSLIRLPRWLSYTRPNTSMGRGSARLRKR